MIITAYILLAFFGFIAVTSTFKFTFSSLNWVHSFLWVVSIIITAVSAGVIWGGLLQ